MVSKIATEKKIRSYKKLSEEEEIDLVSDFQYNRDFDSANEGTAKTRWVQLSQKANFQQIFALIIGFICFSLVLAAIIQIVTFKCRPQEKFDVCLFLNPVDGDDPIKNISFPDIKQTGFNCVVFNYPINFKSPTWESTLNLTLDVIKSANHSGLGVYFYIDRLPDENPKALKQIKSHLSAASLGLITSYEVDKFGSIRTLRDYLVRRQRQLILEADFEVSQNLMSPDAEKIRAVTINGRNIHSMGLYKIFLTREKQQGLVNLKHYIIDYQDLKGKDMENEKKRVQLLIKTILLFKVGTTFIRPTNLWKSTISNHSFDSKSITLAIKEYNITAIQGVIATYSFDQFSFENIKVTTESDYVVIWSDHPKTKNLVKLAKVCFSTVSCEPLDKYEAESEISLESVDGKVIKKKKEDERILPYTLVLFDYNLEHSPKE